MATAPRNLTPKEEEKNSCGTKLLQAGIDVVLGVTGTAAFFKAKKLFRLGEEAFEAAGKGNSFVAQIKRAVGRGDFASARDQERLQKYVDRGSWTSSGVFFVLSGYSAFDLLKDVVGLVPGWGLASAGLSVIDAAGACLGGDK